MRVEMNLMCEETTENSEDEIFYVTAWRTSSGREGGQRFPDHPLHWSVNDNGAKRAINNVWIADVALQPGEVLQVGVAVFEVDETLDARKEGEIAAAVLAMIPSDYTKVAGSILGTIAPFLLVKNTNDFLGAFRFTVTPTAAGAETAFQPVDRVSWHQAAGYAPGSHEFRLNGDGSRYYGWVAPRP